MKFTRNEMIDFLLGRGREATNHRIAQELRECPEGEVAQFFEAIEHRTTKAFDVDWTVIGAEAAAAERAVWWRERLRQGLGQLTARTSEFPRRIERIFQQLAETTEPWVEVALEVTLDVAQKVGLIRAEPARACLGESTSPQFQHVSAANRATRMHGEAAGAKDEGVFIASTIPAARVVADAERESVTVEFSGPVVPLVVVLMPEDSTVAAEVVEIVSVEDVAQARFENLSSGSYLLLVLLSQESKR